MGLNQTEIGELMGVDSGVVSVGRKGWAEIAASRNDKLNDKLKVGPFRCAGPGS